MIRIPRRSKRSFVTESIVVTIEHAGRQYPGQLIDVSAHGACVGTLAKFYGGEKVVMTMCIPGQSEDAIRLRSLVAWTKFSSVQGQDKCGLRFFAEFTTIRSALDFIRKLRHRGNLEERQTFASSRVRRRLSPLPPTISDAY